MFRVCDGHTGFDSIARCVLVAETKGVFLSKAGSDDKGGGLTLFDFLRLVNDSWTRVCIEGKFFVRQLGNGVGIKTAPIRRGER